MADLEALKLATIRVGRSEDNLFRLAFLDGSRTFCAERLQRYAMRALPPARRGFNGAYYDAVSA